MSTYKFVAKDLMTEKVVCVHPDTPIHTLIKILIKNHINGAPVVSKMENLLALFQRLILLNTMKKQAQNEVSVAKNHFIATPMVN